MSEINTYSEEIRQMRDAAGFTTQIFEENFPGKYGDISDFLLNVSGQETLYGTMNNRLYDDGTPISITEFQIDPIRFLDMLERSKTGDAYKRIEMINETFTNLGYQDFDIRNIATVVENQSIDPITGEKNIDYRYSDINKQYLDDPYITTTLARHIIANTEELIPSDLAGQATYWKTHWNTEEGSGTEEEFMNKKEVYINPTNVEDDVMDLLREQDEDPFKIQPAEE